MNLDVNTLFLVTIYVEAILGLLLLFAWVQNTAIYAVAWWGFADLMRAASIMLFGKYGSVSDLISIDLANAILFTAFAVTWTGARVFDHRKPRWILLFAGAALWLVLYRIPAIQNSWDLRMLLAEKKKDDPSATVVQELPPWVALAIPHGDAPDVPGTRWYTGAVPPDVLLSLDPPARIDLFVAMAEEVQTTVARIASDGEVPAEVARYLAAENLPAELVMAPDPALDRVPWDKRPLLAIRRGRAEAGDAVSLTPCLAAIAETGTLMLVSGADTPTTLNFLPDTHIIVLRAGQVVASYEEGWDLVRARSPNAPEGSPSPGWPRTINLITGPSRTGDIEQTLELGAHGPKALAIFIVDPSQDANSRE